LREAQGWLGFAQARSKQSTAWSRLLALVALALLGVASLAPRLGLRGNQQARALRRRVASRRRGRGELSLVRAMISLLHQEPGLYAHLAPRIKLKLDGALANVSGHQPVNRPSITRALLMASARWQSDLLSKYART
jgi:hypothetical protein